MDEAAATDDDPVSAPDPGPSGRPAPSAGPRSAAASAEPPAGSAVSRGTSAADLRRQAARRQALDALFGEVLPDVTADETDRGDHRGRSDRWYSENRPPHHG